ncbi:MAG: anti-sigma factor [Acidobacteriaceae bacterium]
MPDSPSNPSVSSVEGDHRRQASPRWVGWLGWIIAAVAIAVAVYHIRRTFILLHQVNADAGQIAQLKTENARSQKLMDALTSPDATRMNLTETRRPSRPSGHVVYQPSSGTLVFVASGLRPLPQRKSYELWLFPADNHAPVSVGLFHPDANGSASIALLSLPEGVKARLFAVTVEDTQGAPTPTLPIVMSTRK